MKDYLLFVMLLYILNKRKTTAKEISNHFNISQRSVYRYIDSLSLLGVPIITKTGRSGGVELVKTYYINGLMLSKNEKDIIGKYILSSKIPEDLQKVLKNLI